jgi:PGF-CTERM protein
MNAKWGVSVAIAIAVFAVCVAFGAAGSASAAHAPEDANYTVEPMSDRSPGATNVKYGQIVVVHAGIDFETLEKTTAVYEEGSWASCGPGDAEVFGIDRGNTHDGYETDESLEENTKTFSAGEDVFRVEFYGEEDFGPSTHLNNGDAVVSVAQCIDNPDEPGWYQISGSMTGVTEDGERVTIGGESHYFWICDCENEAEARETLGPPPSEPDSTPAPEATEADADGADATETPGEDDSTDAAEPDAEATADSEGDSGGDSATVDESGESEATTGTTDTAPTPTATPGATATSTATPAVDREWSDVVVDTPSPGDGPGFGGPVALAALAAVGLFLRGRSSR